MVEQRTENPRVISSTLILGTIFLHVNHPIMSVASIGFFILANNTVRICETLMSQTKVERVHPTGMHNPFEGTSQPTLLSAIF